MHYKKKITKIILVDIIMTDSHFPYCKMKMMPVHVQCCLFSAIHLMSRL